MANIRRNGHVPFPHSTVIAAEAHHADRPQVHTGRVPPVLDLPGSLATTAVGQHWEIEEHYGQHGNFDTSHLSRLPSHLLNAISNGAITDVPPSRWAFLDTETTGLMGGSGTVAFLVGVGRITAEGFAVRQFFMRDFGEESSQLTALAEHLNGFDVLVTYNGKSFDAPLLETRYRMSRLRVPLERLQHVDILHGSRRIWKAALRDLSAGAAGASHFGLYARRRCAGRHDPAALLRLHQEAAAVLGGADSREHNRLDIVSLACLTAIVPRAFLEPHEIDFSTGYELIGLGRWLVADERYDEGLGLMRRGIDHDIPDDLMFKTLWEIAVTEKKLGRGPGGFANLAQSRNPYRSLALEELAIHYEHREKNIAMALEFASAAGDSPTIAKRCERLQRKLAKAQRRLL